jgi:GNAT superfamily N-acetyltransferase
MTCRDLQTVPPSRLPSELTLRPVRRLAGVAPDGVALEDAVAAILADPRIDDRPDVFAGFVRSLPAAVRLFAAVGRDGAVRATSGSGAFGTEASVLFVNTDPEWRGRGIGQAMTAAALHAARDRGATRACLDATDAGLSIYPRLGSRPSLARRTSSRRLTAVRPAPPKLAGTRTARIRARLIVAR